MSTELERKEKKVRTLCAQIAKLGAMRPGTLTVQYRNPKEKKTPFHQLSYTHRMKSRSEYVRPENLAAVRAETANFRKFKRLVDRWGDLALLLSQLKSKSGAHAACPRAAAHRRSGS